MQYHLLQKLGNIKCLIYVDAIVHNLFLEYDRCLFLILAENIHILVGGIFIWPDEGRFGLRHG